MTWGAWTSLADVPLEEHPAVAGLYLIRLADLVEWSLGCWLSSYEILYRVIQTLEGHDSSIAALLFCGGAQQCVCLFITTWVLFIASMIDIWTQAIVDFIPSDISVSFFFPLSLSAVHHLYLPDYWQWLSLLITDGRAELFAHVYLHSLVMMELILTPWNSNFGPTQKAGWWISKQKGSGFLSKVVPGW